MRSTTRSRGFRYATALTLPAALIAPAVLGGRAPDAAGQTDERELILLPLVLNEVRVPMTVEGHVVVYDPLAAEGRVKLRALRVAADGIVLHEETLDVELEGDPLFGAIQEKLERLPHHLTELHRERHYFAEPGAAEFAGAEVAERTNELQLEVEELRARHAQGGPHAFVELAFPVALDQLFLADDAPGTRRELALEIDYIAADGSARTATVAETIELLAPPLGAPSSFAQTGVGVTIHAGDLHLHSCHGEAANACAPSTDCAAESFQTSGSFSYAALKSQYQALGHEWFTATDHSYCINSASEYSTIQAEIAAITDASFIALPDIELSSDEVGPQTGSDSANILCLFGSPQNHMGAHGITARIPGGSDGFLGFCDPIGGDALASFTANVATIRAQGGWPIVNHPTAASFAWNSFQSTVGIEANGLHGVEIWNGAFVSGQGGGVGRWVDWLLAGRVLYAYSGSDTHDEAFAFGANHAVLVGKPFTPANLQSALRAGSSYVSNGPVALLDVRIGGQDVAMGSRYLLPMNLPAESLTTRLHYDLGGDTGTVTIFRGRVGDADEVALCQSAPLSGAGTFECVDTLTTNVRSWYRAYVETQSGTEVAYTNPVFFEPQSADPGVYCLAKVNSLGCLPAIAFAGTPSASSPNPFLVTAANVRATQNGILFYGFAPDLAPFQDGTRCVANPIKRTAIQNAGGTGGTCDGTYSLDFNQRIQSGIDPALTPGTTVYAQYWTRDPAAPSSTGLTNAVQFTIAP